MKYLFILLTFIIFSCNLRTSTIDRDSNLPIEVVNLKQNEIYDTLLTIQTKEEIYIFNKKGVYVGSMKKTSCEIFYMILGFITSVTLLFFCLYNLNKEN